MPPNSAFHQGSHCLLNNIQSSGTKYNKLFSHFLASHCTEFDNLIIFGRCLDRMGFEDFSSPDDNYLEISTCVPSKYNGQSISIVFINQYGKIHQNTKG